MLRSVRFLTVLVGSLLTSVVYADWALAPDQSSLHFVSVKKDSVGEVHQFTQLSGALAKTGAFEFTIALGSVDTGIDIRNQRMGEHLFELAKFPLAKASGTVDPKVLKKLKTGTPTVLDVEVSIALHGSTLTKTAHLSVVKLSRKQILVVSVRPILIDAKDFGLSGGIAKLKELAGLPSIAESVPVTASLMFVKN